MKVSELKYERADYDRMSGILEDAAVRIRNAADAAAVLEAREKYLEAMVDFSTANALAYMRYTLNTADEYLRPQIPPT